MKELIQRYNTPVPRYTSYPTVPNWKAENFSKDRYIQRLSDGYAEANKEGLSLYIHLPYCESLCTYCGCNTRITVNHKVEGPYVEAVLEEWELIRSYLSQKPKIREIHLGGGTPTFFSPQHLKQLVEGLLFNSEVTKDASFSFEAHPANTTFEHLNTLRKLGFDRLSLGVQDFDPKVQKAINRHQSVSDVQRVIDEARSLGYRSINFDLVYGLPFQTLKGVADAIREVINLRPDRIAFYSYAHVPWMHPGQRAYKESDLPGPEAKLELFTSGREMLLNAGFKAIGFDHFALEDDSLYKAYVNHKMHRNFMGFTELHTPYQIGLGVSSISDIGSGFAQNVKTVEGYIEKVKSGALPIFKGHLLDEEEIFIRKHILNITCKQATTWMKGSEEEKRYMNDHLPNLEMALTDGLVTLEKEGLKVTNLGNTLVRHICAAFDRDFELASSTSRYAKGV